VSQKLIEEYTDFVDKVTSEASKSSDKMNERIEYLNANGVEVSRLLTASIGLSGEVGELNEIIKKVLFQSKTFDSATHEHMKRELGDIMWYVAQACLALNVDLSDVIVTNKDKLSNRFPQDKFNVNNDQTRKAGDV
tara:strand:- start:1395 stop:1802 length:408 start_codon:yes stop_codon:yes gene_type:complete